MGRSLQYLVSGETLAQQVLLERVIHKAYSQEHSLLVIDDTKEDSMRVVEKIRGLCKITFCAIILRHTPDLITPMMKSRSLDMSGSSGTRN